MEWLQHILSRMDRTPKAKRRFNLLREETPAHPASRKGLTSLASFILVTSIPLAGIWQIQSDLDPSLAPTRPSSRIDKAGAYGPILPGPSPALCVIRGDGPKGPDRFGPGETESRDGLLPANDVRAGISGPPAESSESGPAHNRPSKARPPRSSQVTVDDLFQKAQGCQRRKDFETAVEMYRRVLRKSPGHADALFHLSSIYLEQGSYAEAHPLLEDLVRRRPGDPDGLVNLAIAEIALGKPGEAIAHLDTALTLKAPPRFRIYLNKAVALSRLQRLEEAITWYRKAEDLEPRHGSLLFNMAVTFDKLERYKEALRLYTRFLEAGGAPAPRERREVEARIDVLLAYLVEGPKTPSAAGTHRSTEQKR